MLDFRPELTIEGIRVLYLSEAYLDILLRFLTGKDEYLIKTYHREPNGYEQAEGEGVELRERLRYLNESLRIIHGHFGEGWHFPTHPPVNALVLDTNLRTAVIHYRSGYEFYLALMEYRDNKWVVADRCFLGTE